MKRERERERESQLWLFFFFSLDTSLYPFAPHDIETGFSLRLFFSLAVSMKAGKAKTHTEKKRIRNPQPRDEKRKDEEQGGRGFLFFVSFLATAAAPRWQSRFFVSAAPHVPSQLTSLPPPLFRRFRPASSSRNLPASLAQGEAQRVLQCSAEGATPRPRPSAPGGGRARSAASTQQQRVDDAFFCFSLLPLSLVPFLSLLPAPLLPKKQQLTALMRASSVSKVTKP